MGARWAWTATCQDCGHTYSNFSGGADDCYKCGSSNVIEHSPEEPAGAYREACHNVRGEGGPCGLWLCKMIRRCDVGHLSLNAADWRCPWCEIERLRAELERRKVEYAAVLDGRRAEVERLRAKVQRLEARGIEDMRHSIEAALAVAKDALHRIQFAPEQERETVKFVVGLMVQALKGEEGK